MRQIFLPVWAHSRFIAMARDLQLPGVDAGPGSNPAWIDASPLRYAHGLISYVHWKRPFVFPPGAHIFGDSGGFTLGVGRTDVRLDPVAVLEWQAGLCTVGCILDLPPWAGGRRVWERALETTVANTRRALPVYERLRAGGSAFRWWGVIHGNTPDEQEIWRSAVAAVYPFTDEGEGWALRAEPYVHPFTVASSLRMARRAGLRRMHFLAATGYRVIATLLCLGQEAGLDLVTYDSTFAIKSGLNRRILRADDTGFRWTNILESEAEMHVRHYLRDECACAVCADLRHRTPPRRSSLLPVKNGFSGWDGLWLQLHNVQTQLDVIARQWAAAQRDPAGLLREVLPRTNARDVAVEGAHRYARVRRFFEGGGGLPTELFRVAGKGVITGSTRTLLDML
jgi:hypothetical protein